MTRFVCYGRPTQRAPDPRANTGVMMVGRFAARFQAVLVAQGWFRQSDYIASRLVVEPVETHQRVPRREHAGQAASRWAAENTQGI